jgi:hypothetical protein
LDSPCQESDSVGGGGREGVDQAVERRVVVVAKLGFSDVDGESTGGAVRW